jgi:hypothetical protein
MTNTDNFTIRKMTRKDMDTIMSWAIAEKWNPGLSDADSFYYTDPEGFLIAELDGEPVSCVSVVRYGDNFGFLGMYLAKQEYKGRGFGLKVFRAGMEFLGDRNIGLDGVVTQIENYKKSGFKIAYYNERFEGIGNGSLFEEVIEIAEVPFGKLVEYDSRLFPASRPKFLELWIKPPNIGLAIVKNNVIQGYGVIRPLQVGYRVGPIFAENDVLAETLFSSLTSYAKGVTFNIDIPEVNKSALALMKKNNLQNIAKTARMYTKEFPDLPFDKIYALTSLALG